MRKKPTTYRKRTQRTAAFDTELLTDCQSLEQRVSLLRCRADKSARQWRKDCRLAHSLEQRQTRTVRALYRALHSTKTLPDNIRRKLDNRVFAVSQLKPNTLDYTPRWSVVGGGKEFEFSERYRKERGELDKQQRKRQKN